jgi:hypothetical protein
MQTDAGVAVGNSFSDSAADDLPQWPTATSETQMEISTVPPTPPSSLPSKVLDMISKSGEDSLSKPSQLTGQPPSLVPPSLLKNALQDYKTFLPNSAITTLYAEHVENYTFLEHIYEHSSGMLVGSTKTAGQGGDEDDEDDDGQASRHRFVERFVHVRTVSNDVLQPPGNLPSTVPSLESNRPPSQLDEVPFGSTQSIPEPSPITPPAGISDQSVPSIPPNDDSKPPASHEAPVHHVSIKIPHPSKSEILSPSRGVPGSMTQSVAQSPIMPPAPIPSTPLQSVPASTATPSSTPSSTPSVPKIRLKLKLSTSSTS